MKVSTVSLMAFVALSQLPAVTNAHFLRRFHKENGVHEEYRLGTSRRLILSDVIPDHCKYVNTTVEEECPEPPPPTLPRKCSGISASWSGDPHFKTFDGLKYDCQGAGEFDVVKSLDSQFSLQGRFVKFREDKRPTVTTSVAFVTGDEGIAKIQVNTPLTDADGCVPYVFVDGEKKDISNEDKKKDSFELSEGIIAKVLTGKDDEDGGGGGGFVFYYEESQIQLQVNAKTSSKNGCVLRADLCIPDCTTKRGERFVGLLGTPDGDKSNDWIDRSGTEHEVRAKVSKYEQDFCGTWCVDNVDDSIFTYESGEAFEDYENCEESKEPDVDTEDCVKDPITYFESRGKTNKEKKEGKKIVKVCGEGERFRECIVDGCMGGTKMAKSYVKSYIKSVDTDCGKELYYENFEGENLPSNFQNIVEKSRMEELEGKSKKKTKFLYLNKDSPPVDFPLPEIPEGTELIQIEFNFYELGVWEKEGKKKKDSLNLIVNDVDFSVGKFFADEEQEENEKKGDKKAGGIEASMKWKSRTISESGDLGFGDVGGTQDEMHKVTLSIPPAYWEDNDGVLNFAIKANIQAEGEGAEEGAGINNFRVLAYKGACKVDCDGVVVMEENFDESGESDWGATMTLTDGSVVLGPLKNQEDKLEKTFEVLRYAGIAELSFLLYELDNFESVSFKVTINERTFNLGVFQEADNDKAVEGTVQKNNKQILWKREVVISDADVTEDSDKADRVHQVTVTVPKKYFKKKGFLYVAFSPGESIEDSGASFAIDDFSIQMKPEAEACEKASSEVESSKATTCPAQSSSELEEDKCYTDISELLCSPTASPGSDAPTQAPTPTKRSFSTPQPTPSPTKPPSYISGDPHIRTWTTQDYDFHGECDLVLLKNSDFNDGQGLHIHVRTKIERWWSYIDAVAIMIGSDVVEIKSGIQDRLYWVNGEQGRWMRSSGPLDFTVGGFGGRFRVRSDNVIQYKLFLPDNQNIIVRSVKDMLRVELDQCNKRDFGHSLGLMGTYTEGLFLARNESTVLSDANAFGQEWQVRPDDPQIFRAAEGPQFPEQCRMPTTSETSRRLTSSIPRGEAERACRLVSKLDFKNCVLDVLATDDVDAAETYY